jgi:hypothetical protein
VNAIEDAADILELFRRDRPSCRALRDGFLFLFARTAQFIQESSQRKAATGGERYSDDTSFHEGFSGLVRACRFSTRWMVAREAR